MMETMHDSAAVSRQIDDWHGRGESVALVPTMGALHAGHMSLLALARRHATRVVASIFVNPTQFAAGEDLERYPRPLAADTEALQAAGCDLLFAPEVSDIYPPGFATSVHVGGISETMEGRMRPGHFDGVATIVTRLLMLGADVAVFGEKDWQQLAVIRRLVADLGLRVRILSAPIVREADGLALSSRNRYLGAGERAAAATLPRALAQAAQRIAGGAEVAETIAQAREQLQAAGFTVDYLLLADGDSLAELTQAQQGARLFVAARIGTTRLIDNLSLAAASH